MPRVFRSADETVERMLSTYKEVTGVDLRPTDLGREEVVRTRQFAIALSSQSAELQRIDDDTYPASASIEGLIRHLAARALPGRALASKSNGSVRIFGEDATTIGETIETGTEFERDLDGSRYRTLSAVKIQAIAQQFTVTTLADSGGSLDGLYFNFDTLTTGYYVWINVDSGGNDPAPAGRTGIAVAIASGATANQVASAIQSAVNAISGVTAGVAGSLVTITNDTGGEVTDAPVDVDTGFTFAVVNEGSWSTTVAAESVDTGQARNIETDEGVEFTLSEPIDGIKDTIVSVSQFRDGRDVESGPEMLSRIQTYDQQDDTGGNPVAYERWAREADSAVTKATAIKLARGPNTVDVVIQSGTTDIRAAVENGDSVTRLASATLVADVLAYMLDQNPITDDLEVVAPTEDSFDVEVKYDLFDETLRSDVDAVIRREVDIFIYTAAPQDRLEPTDLERAIDAQVGHLIRARRVSNFDGSTVHFTVPDDKLLTPGTVDTSNF